MPDYILITPVLNEQDNIVNCIASVILQTHLPIKWVIIDGGSTDNTLQIISSFNISWLKVITQTDTSMPRGHEKFSHQMQEAYEYCKNTFADYIGKMDADCSISRDFFEMTIKGCEQDRTLGAVSGKMYTNGIPENYPDDEIPDIRLYRKKALEDIGGFPITKYSPDTVILAKLRLNGWRIQTFPKVTINNTRKRDSNSVTFGKARWHLGYSLPLFLLGTAYATRNNGMKYGVGLCRGYLGDMFRGSEQTKDVQIYDYFHNKRLNEIAGTIGITPRTTLVVASFVFLFVMIVIMMWWFK